MVILEELVPEDHLLRKIEKAIPMGFIYEIVEPLYSKVGAPSIDPVRLFKMAFINRLYGINSMRRTTEEIRVNLAYRWYLGLDIDDPVPHFSDFSKKLHTQIQPTYFDTTSCHRRSERNHCVRRHLRTNSE